MVKKKITLPIEAEVPVELAKALPLPPATTEQEDIAAEAEREALHRLKDSQRRINLIWESTQAITAILITLSVIYCVVKSIQADVLTNAFFLIVSMYFVRTNHSLVGGIGAKPANESR